jgi:putative transposase
LAKATAGQVGGTGVMSRGDQRDDIFFNDVDRYDFVKTLSEACLKTDWLVHAFCLMKNHYHLVVETPGANLVAGMAWLLRAPAGHARIAAGV